MFPRSPRHALIIMITIIMIIIIPLLISSRLVVVSLLLSSSLSLLLEARMEESEVEKRPARPVLEPLSQAASSRRAVQSLFYDQSPLTHYPH